MSINSHSHGQRPKGLTHIVERDVQCMIRFGLSWMMRSQGRKALGHCWNQVEDLLYRVPVWLEKQTILSASLLGNLTKELPLKFWLWLTISFSSKICFVVKDLLKESWKWSLLKNLGISEWISFSAQPFLGASPWSRQTRAGAGDDDDNDNHHHDYHYNHENY